jgi:hypothetical protein
MVIVLLHLAKFNICVVVMGGKRDVLRIAMRGVASSIGGVYS